MTHDSKNGFIVRLYYFMKAEPRFLTLLVGYAAFAAAALITSEFIWLMLMVAWCGLFIVADGFIMCYGRCIRYVTQSFYIFRFAGWNYIYQYRKKDGKTCEDMKKDLIYEENNLLGALPDGRYIAITYTKIILILLAADNVSLLRCVPVYKRDLLSIQNKMMGCKKCREKRFCGLRKAGAIPRQFCYVEFVKY